MSTASRRAFNAEPETCPKVDDARAALEDSLDKLRNALEEAEPALEKYREAEQDGRDRLRSALIAAYEEIEDLEDQLAQLDKSNQELEKQVGWLKDDLAVAERDSEQ